MVYTGTRRSSCLLIFQNIVPISLYITVEIVKTVGCFAVNRFMVEYWPYRFFFQIQAYFIFQDVEMYYEPCGYQWISETDIRLEFPH